MRIWKEAVRRAILRHIAATGSPLFTRQALFAAEGVAMAVETKTTGLTPTQTATRELQQLRDDGLVEFVDRGTYRWLGEMPEDEPVVPSNGVLVLDTGAAGAALPERHYVVPPEWRSIARRLVGEWIVYQDGGGYRSVAKVERIASGVDGGWSARIERNSYLEFGRIVPMQLNGEAIERALSKGAGGLDRTLASRPVRAISRGEFDRIVELGLVTDGELLPREDAADVPPAAIVSDERVPWEGPVSRTSMLVNRAVRDRQFRARVLQAYGSECALTGMNLFNGGGRAEVQAAHIMSVEAGGPDAVNNGIALSGTVHWMFDRGLISLGDEGEILLSRAINDPERVERMIHADRMARFPAAAAQRPHPRYLHWHRTACFHH